MTIQRTDFADGYSISRIIKGGWQLAGGHGDVDRKAAIADMHTFADAGITTFDCADIYTGVEELIGEFIAERRKVSSDPIQIHTKLVPDIDRLTTWSAQDTRVIVERSLRRLGVDRVDMVQFHWWDYGIKRYDEAIHHLEELRREGLIRHVSVTNFDTEHLAEVHASGVTPLSNQVQYSLLDRRPGTLAATCASTGMKLIAYGVLGGGFLSERYLGTAEPQEPQENRSLTKYKLIIDECGGWQWFQSLLETLGRIARKHDTSVSAVCIHYILCQSHVAAVAVGVRNAGPLQALMRVNDVALDEEDNAAIARIRDQATGPTGEVYELERDINGRHGRIMRYTLNRSRELSLV